MSNRTHALLAQKKYSSLTNLGREEAWSKSGELFYIRHTPSQIEIRHGYWTEPFPPDLVFGYNQAYVVPTFVPADNHDLVERFIRNESVENPHNKQG